MSASVLSFSEIKNGQIFSHDTCEGQLCFYMKVIGFCTNKHGLEELDNKVDNTEYNAILLNGPNRGNPFYFFASERFLMTDKVSVTNQQVEPVKVSFVDCDGGHDDGVSVFTIDDDA
jgi:hypothetical protein